MSEHRERVTASADAAPAAYRRSWLPRVGLFVLAVLVLGPAIAVLIDTVRSGSVVEAVSVAAAAVTALVVLFGALGRLR